MSGLFDQAARDRFIRERERNCSLLAPAGVGKTHTIVQRLIQIAQEPQAQETLPRLVVVTFSVKAAQEMQNRARLALAETEVTSVVRRAFQQVYFGTIHSYCVRLLERFGSHLGLSAPIQLVEDERELWEQFLRLGFPALSAEDEKATEILFALYPVRLLFSLGQILPPGPAPAYLPRPEVHLQPLLSYQTTSKGSTRLSVERRQKEALLWEEAWQKGKWHPLPDHKNSTDEVFRKLWEETFSSLRAWVQRTAEVFGRKLACHYELFRMREGVMTYDDQLRWAERLLSRPEISDQIRAEKISVILDEAQDTSPLQFEILRRVVGLSASAEEAAGTLSLIGDFQQLIYDSVDEPRAEAAVYQRLHEDLSTGPRGSGSTLQVTFRCDQAIVDWVNDIFPDVLTGKAGQVSFVALNARESAGPGQVVRCVPPVTAQAGEKEAVVAHREAAFLAEHLRRLGLSGLGVAAWREVALLCPRNAWLAELARELRLVGLPVQVHSTQERIGAQVAVRWLTALVWVAAHPEDAFQVVGILRDLYGLSDEAIAHFTAGQGARLRLDQALPAGGGEVAAVLAELQRLVQEAARLPLHRAVRWLAEKTDLAARIVSLPEEEEEETKEHLETVFRLATERAATGGTLAELAEELRQRLGQVRPQEEEIQDALQLVSGHKAKGLEWPVVVLPFLFRPVKYQAPPYPRYRRLGETWRVMLDERDQSESEKKWVEEQRQQSLARLLYVLTTRARYSLILVDDAALWTPLLKKKGAALSLAGLWELSGKNLPHWQALPVSLQENQEKRKLKPEPKVPPLPEISPQDVERARLQANAISRRITPHALARFEPADPSPLPEDRPEISADHPGILYGTWWHELMEEIAWSQPRDRWQRSFTQKVATAPQPERAQLEWELFQRSELAQWLSQPGRIIHREWPFLWPESDGQVVEGVMDLVAGAPGEKIWRVIDWKTNRVPEAGAESLREIYRGQIEAYVRALRELLAIEVRGSLYLTATGQWLEV